jgi:L-2-hydroxyglutarate oxidase LhgO
VYDVDCVVIGAGVVGLAVARAISAGGREVLVVEAERDFGTGISSRNSEVIHSGIYYPQNSLKARLCVRGRQLLYSYCARNGIPHQKRGKLIVAIEGAQSGALTALHEKGQANGVEDLDMLDAGQAVKMEPQLRCKAALHSPLTGILDSHALMLSLLGDAERSGATIAYRAPVVGGRAESGGIVLAVGGEQPTELSARTVINCAGLGARRVAIGIDGAAVQAIPPLYLAKGNYFSLSGRSPFSRLVYPLPEPGGLGVHLTLDLAGQARFGPDVEWIEEENYDVSPRRAEKFYAAIRRYWPGLGDAALNPAYAGIRPKICGPGGGDADFVFQGAEQHGVPGLINLFGIESPGLTASLAIGEDIAGIAGAL